MSDASLRHQTSYLPPVPNIIWENTAQQLSFSVFEIFVK